jgi:hypothetical protein
MPRRLAPVPPLTPPLAKGREKFHSAKIPCNPLKRLDSDERIQGNPSFSNPHKRGLRANWPVAKKTQTGDRTKRRARLEKEPNRLL